jgi:hypothetical protein
MFSRFPIAASRHLDASTFSAVFHDAVSLADKDTRQRLAITTLENSIQCRLQIALRRYTESCTTTKLRVITDREFDDCMSRMQ